MRTACRVDADSMSKAQHFKKLIVRVDVINGLAGCAGVVEMLIGASQARAHTAALPRSVTTR